MTTADRSEILGLVCRTFVWAGSPCPHCRRYLDGAERCGWCGWVP